MLGSKLRELLGRARGPLGQAVSVDFGDEHTPLKELAELLSEMNGFFAFNAGVQIFHAGGDGFGPELSYWNARETWKEAFDGLADKYFCFGQDILGMQYAIQEGTALVRFDPETARSSHIGYSLEDWAAWLLDNPEINGTSILAKVWQDQKGPLEPGQRLVPLKFFEFGGEVSFDNLVVKDAVEAMRVRGPIAVQIHDLPPGSEIRLQS
ncbi:hypothetical protein [Actinopolyspora mortivallis]|uniref:hypothetical protein n=1 Tax=Actinopolyspora mortivallis TaxID=33906 RepID=UPI000378B4CD|nr:hypothetical protein [Actinopolyspora mortivallis]